MAQSLPPRSEVNRSEFFFCPAGRVHQFLLISICAIHICAIHICVDIHVDMTIQRVNWLISHVGVSSSLGSNRVGWTKQSASLQKKVSRCASNSIQFRAFPVKLCTDEVYFVISHSMVVSCLKEERDSKRTKQNKVQQTGWRVQTWRSADVVRSIRWRIRA
jgi:hypothetical protein